MKNKYLYQVVKANFDTSLDSTAYLKKKNTSSYQKVSQEKHQTFKNQTIGHDHIVKLMRRKKVANST